LETDNLDWFPTAKSLSLGASKDDEKEGPERTK